MQKPKVSVIVPVYNVEEYLEKCLYRLVRQTLEDIEIIVVNDGSPDHSQKIIDNYVNRYPEKVFGYIKENGGLSDARNYGIDRARGEYFAFIDSDDFAELDMMERLYKTAVEKGADVVVCSYNKVKESENTEDPFVVTKKSILHPEFFGNDIHKCPGILRYSTSYAWNKLYKRELFKNIRYPKGQTFEDSAVTYNILAKAKKIELIGDALYNYRIARKGAITTTVNNKIFDVFKSCESIINYYKKNNIFEEFHNEVEYLCIMHIYARIRALKTSNDFKLIFKFVNEAFGFLDGYFDNWRNNTYYFETRINAYVRDALSVYNNVRDHKFQLKCYFVLRKSAKFVKKVLDKLLSKFRIKSTGRRRKRINPQLSVEDLERLQKLELKILKTVDKFCTDNCIRYYLAEGTLLGAVRHQGFIPWDDDVDIAMPREDYERFIKLWEDREIDSCILLHEKTYEKYYLPFAKVVLTEPTDFKSFQRLVPEKYQGPNIDVFPLDDGRYYTDIEQIKSYKRLRKLRNILLVKVGYIKNKRTRRKHGLKAKIYSYNTLHEKIKRQFMKFSRESTDYIVNYASSYPVNRECFKKDLFGEPIRAPFEDCELNIPQNADAILKTIYYDYMQLPPEEQQVSRHSFYVASKVEEVR